MLREKIYCDRKELDDFLLLLPSATLNKSIYETLLTIREPDPVHDRPHRLNVPALQIFNEAYYQCTKLHIDKHPEEDIYNNYFIDARENLGSTIAAEVVFSIIFVLLSSMKNRTVKTENFAQIIRERLSPKSAYFGLFVPIAEHFQSEGVSFSLSFIPTPVDVRSPGKLSWASITHNFNPQLVAEAVQLANNEEGQHAILDAIETQFRQSHPYNENGTLDAAFASLRTAIIARFPKDTHGYKKEDCLAINTSLIAQKEEVEKAFADLSRKYRDLLTDNQELKKNQFSVTALLQIARERKIRDIYQVLGVFAAGISDLPARVKVEQEIADNMPKPVEPFTSKIYLSPKRGKKLNVERIINVAWQLDFFVDEDNERAKKQTVFDAFGHCLNSDLSNFEASLSEGRSCANSDCANELAIFEAMLKKQKEINGLPT
jgi:hypothetical protein